MAFGGRSSVVRKPRSHARAADRHGTFLFTDIEGSTRLLSELGEEYADVLAEHRRALRHAFAEHGGVEVDTQGDAFFVAFARVSDAVAAAAAGQAALAPGSGPRPDGNPHRRADGDAGRLRRSGRPSRGTNRAAGHGGQVLLTQTTRDFLAEQEVRDLGEHRLKDLSRPQHLYQLGGEEFPPLKPLYATNLPSWPARCSIARTKCASSSHSSPTAPPGDRDRSGRDREDATRHAGRSRARRRHQDGVFWVPLAECPTRSSSCRRWPRRWERET